LEEQAWSDGKKKNRNMLKSNVMTVSVVALIVFAVLLISLTGNYISKRNMPVETNGVFDLNTVDFDAGESVYLTGDWKFYDNAFIVSEPIEGTKVTTTLKVPSAYNYISTESKYAASGISSYECIINNVNSEDHLTVYIPNIACAYRIYINSVLVASSGNAASDYSDIWTTASSSRLPFALEPDAQYRIVVELAAHNNIGLYMPVKLANYNANQTAESQILALRFITCGIIFSCAFIFIFLKRFVDKELYSLWLPILSFVLLIRTLLTSESYAVIQRLLFDISFEDISVFTFMATFIIKLIALVYIAKCLKINLKDNVYVSFSALFLSLAVCINFLPNSVFDIYYYMVLQLLSIIIDIFIINKLCIEIVKKTDYAILYLLSYIFIVIGLMVDALYVNGLLGINFSSVMPVCFFIFVLFTSIIHAIRIKRIFNYALSAQQLETELERANVQIMLSQIQPHFMYNALNTIKSLIKRDPEKAENAVIDFSLYLRGNMDSLTKTDPIPFSEELAHVKYYCNIEQLRFQDKLDVFYEIGPDSFYVPTLSVQPIVENAIKHGVTKKAEGGSVTISTSEDDDNFYIVVEDDGVGFDVKEAFNKQFDKRSHVGLKNIKERFETIMGAKVYVESEIGVGSKFTVKLPKDRNVATLQEISKFEQKSSLEEMDI
jgi:sensor histidine kinase YesM